MDQEEANRLALQQRYLDALLTIEAAAAGAAFELGLDQLGQTILRARREVEEQQAELARTLPSASNDPGG